MQQDLKEMMVKQEEQEQQADQEKGELQVLMEPQEVMANQAQLVPMVMKADRDHQAQLECSVHQVMLDHQA